MIDCVLSYCVERKEPQKKVYELKRSLDKKLKKFHLKEEKKKRGAELDTAKKAIFGHHSALSKDRS